MNNPSRIAIDQPSLGAGVAAVSFSCDELGVGVGAGVGIALGALGSTESRGSSRGGFTTTPTTLNSETSTKGFTVATRDSSPAVPVTSTTSPIGSPGAYGRPPFEPKVTTASPEATCPSGSSNWNSSEFYDSY